MILHVSSSGRSGQSSPASASEPWCTSSRSSRLTRSTTGPSSRITAIVPGPIVAPSSQPTRAPQALDGAVAPAERHRRVPGEAGSLDRAGAEVGAEVDRDAERQHREGCDQQQRLARHGAPGCRSTGSSQDDGEAHDHDLHHGAEPGPAPGARPRWRGSTTLTARLATRTGMSAPIETPLTSVEKPSDPRSAVSSIATPGAEDDAAAEQQQGQAARGGAVHARSIPDGAGRGGAVGCRGAAAHRPRLRRDRLPRLGPAAGPAHGAGRARAGARHRAAHDGDARSPSPGAPTPACTPAGRSPTSTSSRTTCATAAAGRSDEPPLDAATRAGSTACSTPTSGSGASARRRPASTRGSPRSGGAMPTGSPTSAAGRRPARRAATCWPGRGRSTSTR